MSIHQPTRWAQLVPHHLYPQDTGFAGHLPMLHEDRFIVDINRQLMPNRYVVSPHVTSMQSGVTVSLISGQLFDQPRPGQYAWQSYGYNGSSNYRQVSIPISAFHGADQAISRLRALLNDRRAQKLVRVTPEGIMIRLVPYLTRFVLPYEPSRYVADMLRDKPSNPLASQAKPTWLTDYSQPQEVEATPMFNTRILQCTFGSSSTRYAYYTDDKTIVEGDYVTVVSPHGDGPRIDGGHLTVVRVASVTETYESVTKVVKWVVGKVDISEHTTREQRREELCILDAKIAKAEAAARRALELSQLRNLSPELALLINQREMLTR